MVLHQPRGLSLSDDEDLGLLLRALSTRLAGYSLVTTVIECSRFYKVNCNESWIGKEEGVQEGGNWSTDSGILTPLCSVAAPRPWELHCARRQQFKGIREHFYTMANLRHTTGTEARHESAGQQTSGMVDVLAMFGLDSLQELVRDYSRVLHLLRPIGI
ncbi:hypothetical protein PISMIDRAFT_595452 [Pisolithus microcarpus 441]|uniref:Uncharacterized protein n=1 Tax=Pisolithus microcarpus 441 TaxID=765257 RepID=A0A0C9ZK23_9AGAM|nr:hypothetical protein BKA83DRAFT_595452 [Pisolithus microcarpus]KIK20288.1 hypothetical protein PISMIDRAFT_595452 [Pisolithus microcarpus 441]